MGFFKTVRKTSTGTRPKTQRELVRDVTKTERKGTIYNKIKFGRKSKTK
jgi:hypothetical protein